MTYRILPQYSGKTRISLRIAAGLVVPIARVLSEVSPWTIQQILTYLSRNFSEASPAQVLEWRDAVNNISPRCAGNGCLQRSIAVALLARLFRRKVIWKAGFRTDPFLAHAWVEIQGEPIGEPEEVANYHVTISTDMKNKTSN